MSFEVLIEVASSGQWASVIQLFLCAVTYVRMSILPHQRTMKLSTEEFVS